MKESLQKHRDQELLAIKLVGEVDIITTCPKCGGEVGIWSTEPETLCVFCQYRVFDREKTNH